VPTTERLLRGFGRALRELRVQADLTEERSGLTRNYISDLELGLKNPSLRTIGALAKALSVLPHELVRAAVEG
jgi:transcriptional regulator with XRE-family HTH domain